MSVIVLAGITGGLGKLLLRKCESLESWNGAPIKLIIGVDFLPTEEKLLTAQRQYESRKHPINILHWDATRLESTLDVTRRIDALSETVDLLVLATGLGFHGKLSDTTLQQTQSNMERMMTVNAFGPSLLAQHCAKKMKKRRGAATAVPAMLVLSSYSGVVGLSYRAAYCASKFALNGFLESLFAEYRDDIRIVLACPTSVKTAFRGNWKKQLKGGNTKADEKEEADEGPSSSSDMSPEFCIDEIWKDFACKSAQRTPQVQYIILPRGKTVYAYWCLRLPLIRNYARWRVQQASAKL